MLLRFLFILLVCFNVHAEDEDQSEFGRAMAELKAKSDQAFPNETSDADPDSPPDSETATPNESFAKLLDELKESATKAGLNDPPTQVFILVGDTKDIAPMDNPVFRNLHRAKQDLRHRGYTVHTIKKIQLPLLLEILGSTDTAAVIYHGHSAPSLNTADPVLPAYMGAEKVPIDSTFVGLSQDLAGRSYFGPMGAKLFFGHSCESAYCKETVRSLGLGRIYGGFRGFPTTKREGGFYVWESGDREYAPDGAAGSILYELPPVHPKASKDWNKRNEIYQIGLASEEVLKSLAGTRVPLKRYLIHLKLFEESWVFAHELEPAYKVALGKVDSLEELEEFMTGSQNHQHHRMRSVASGLDSLWHLFSDESEKRVEQIRHILDKSSDWKAYKTLLDEALTRLPPSDWTALLEPIPGEEGTRRYYRIRRRLAQKYKEQMDAHERSQMETLLQEWDDRTCNVFTKLWHRNKSPNLLPVN